MAVTLTALLANTALAQSSAPQGPEARSPEARSEAQGSFQDIIVTARRREEKLQDVPAAVTAFTQGDLQKQGLVSLTDIARVTPSLAISPSSGDPMQGSLTIRGQGGSKQGSGPAVVSYNNEVPIVDNSKSRSIIGPNFFFDLANLQVLKGPQGTLFGRNSTGGALLLVTQRPTDRFGGYLDVGAGSFGTVTADGAINLPLVGDTLMLRVAGSYQKQDGHAHSLGQPGHATPFSINNINYLSGRVTLLWRPTDRLENQLMVQASRTSTNGFAKILTYLDPNGAVAQGFGPLGVNAIYAQQQALGPFTQVPTTDPGYYKRKYLSVIDTFSWKLTDDITFRNIASFQTLRTPSEPPDEDYDGTVFPIIGGCCVTTPNLVKQYTEEAQLQGRSFDRLQWTVGAFFLSSPFQRPTVYTFRAFGANIPNIEAFKERSIAVYGQGTYDLSGILPGLGLTLGVRETWDKRGAASNQSSATQFFTASNNFSATTWTTGLSYKAAPDILFYFDSRRGYRSGGLNTTIPDPSKLTFGPETVTDFELGVKTSWSAGPVKARTNFDVYHQDYNDVQQSVSVFMNGLAFGYIANAGKARVNGAEFEQVFTVDDKLTLNGSVSYLDYKTTRFAPGVDTADLVPVPAPKWSYTLGANLKLFDTEPFGKGSVRADWTWTSKRNDIVLAGPMNDPLKVQGPVGVLNLGASLESIGGLPVDLSLVVKNATNKVYSLGGFAFTPGGFDSNVFAEPRRIKINLSYHFGS